jgi:DNA-nicking Smr family endonuclease
MKRMAKDVELFRSAMADVKPLNGRKTAKPVGPKPKAERPAPVPPDSFAPRSKPAAGMAGVETPAFDRDVDRALARGRRRPEAKLDLHGLTLAAAQQAVSAFIAEASGQDRRVVLIVTGKGLRLDGGRVLGGRIRAEFMAWLERPENRARVAGVRPAHSRHGGSGAFYVLLRRRSSASSRSLRATPQR